MKRTDFTFASRDNQTMLHAVRWEPENTEVTGVLQIVHGMAEHVDRYEAFAEFMTSKGFVVTADDHLGHGKSVPEGGVKGYFCKQDPATVVVRDVHRLKKLTQEQYIGVPYYILGHSMGSFILRNYLFRYGKGIDGAIVMGTGMVPKPVAGGLKLMASLGCLFGRSDKPSKFIDNIAFGGYQKKMTNPRTSCDWLTKDEAIVDKYIADPDCGFTFTNNGFKTMGELILRLHKKSNIEKMPVTLPVLFVSGKEDPVGDYGEAVTRVFNSFREEGMQKVSIKLYDNDRHELLNETDKETVYEDIYEWLVKKEK